MDFSSLGYAGLAGSGIAAIGNMGASYLNFGLQKEQFDYQKALQQQIFQREDTALQRRMQDAAAAGLNPYSVINSGGASSGSVVKTQAPQLSTNFNGILDMVNTMIDLEYKKAQTEGERKRAENAAKEGLYLDSKITGQNWQNNILGWNANIAEMEQGNYFLDSLRNQAEFNYDFGTNMRYLMDSNGRYTHELYDSTNLRPDYYGQPGSVWFDRQWYYDNNIKKENLVNQYTANLYENWYNNYAYNEQKWQNEILSHQRSMAEKEDSWYNWNQGFNMVDRVFDDVTGLLFKKLDLGLSRENSASSNYKNYAQGRYYNRRR